MTPARAPLPPVVGCDWGTTTLRLRLLDPQSGEVRAEATAEEGVRRTWERWRAEGGDREGVYLEVLGRRLAELEARAGASLAGALVVVSGMASSSVGIGELPYGALPFDLGGERLPHRWLERALPGGQRVLLLSGLRDAEDVMRGEETQLVGLAGRLEPAPGRTVVVLPGTHSKHVRVEGSAVVGFRTLMTGELFEAAAAHTLLQGSVRRAPLEEARLPALRAGVRAGLELPLLHALFRTRARSLLEGADPADGYWFLSGVLVGSEVAALAADRPDRVVLCAGPGLAPPYREALREAGLEGRTHALPAEWAELAAAWGQLALLRRFGDP